MEKKLRNRERLYMFVLFVIPWETIIIGITFKIIINVINTFGQGMNFFITRRI
jgi:hypothetical protein